MHSLVLFNFPAERSRLVETHMLTCWSVFRVHQPCRREKQPFFIKEDSGMPEIISLLCSHSTSTCSLSTPSLRSRGYWYKSYIFTLLNLGLRPREYIGNQCTGVYIRGYYYLSGRGWRFALLSSTFPSLAAYSVWASGYVKRLYAAGS